jgi:hypothetical protein
MSDSEPTCTPAPSPQTILVSVQGASEPRETKLTTNAVNMSGDDLKSAEKRAADAAMEKENMRVAMTATEQKAISTTYVVPTNPLRNFTKCYTRERDLILHPWLRSEWVRYGVFLAFDSFSRRVTLQTPANNRSQDAMRQMQAIQSGVHTGSDPRRRRADDHLLRVHELRQPLEVLMKR